MLMTPQTDFLKKLISAPGLSGFETPVARLIAEAWKPLADRVETGRLGNVQAIRLGQGAEPRPSLLLAAHMDAIGLMVTRITDGLLHFTEIGGIDPRILPGQVVTVHGREDLPAVVVQPPAWLLPTQGSDDAVPMEHLLIDIGLLPAQVERLVSIGDIASFAQPPVELTGETIAGHSLDNRAAVAVLTICLQELQRRAHQWDVWAVATVQEEETFAGAITSAYSLRPSAAVVVDVTFAKGPGTSDPTTFPLAKGPTLIWGPNIHPALHKRLKEVAERFEIPFQAETNAANSGTDAVAIQVIREGIPCAVLGIPLRYMHTPVELVAFKDIDRAGRWLAELITGLEPDFIDKINWDEKL